VPQRKRKFPSDFVGDERTESLFWQCKPREEYGYCVAGGTPDGGGQFARVEVRFPLDYKFGLHVFLSMKPSDGLPDNIKSNCVAKPERREVYLATVREGRENVTFCAIVAE